MSELINLSKLNLTYYPTSGYLSTGRIFIYHSIPYKYLPKASKRVLNIFNPLVEDCETNEKALKIFNKFIKLNLRGIKLDVGYFDKVFKHEKVKSFEELRDIAAIACRRGISTPDIFTFATKQPRIEEKNEEEFLSDGVEEDAEVVLKESAEEDVEIALEEEDEEEGTITMLDIPSSQQHESQVVSTESLCFCSLSSSSADSTLADRS